jgi:hypothetical protein
MNMPRFPAEVVFHPSWWFRHAGITFDVDFFFHPARRVEVEQQMEKVLHERFGHLGLGRAHGEALPVVGAVHLAAGFLLSEMLGCDVRYRESDSPEVVPAGVSELKVDVEQAFRSPAFRRFSKLEESLAARHGRLVGDVNWGGVLNLALDLRGQELFLDMADRPDEVQTFFNGIAGVLGRFVTGMQERTGSSSISVTRIVRHLPEPIYLHSECSNTMVSAEDYERFLLPIDQAWGRSLQPFGIHHCGKDAHRFAKAYAKVPDLAFLDLGWGGDVAILREALPNTFFSLRLSPVVLAEQTPAEIRSDILRLVAAAGGPEKAGICCINLDASVTDEQVAAIFTTAEEIRQNWLAGRTGAADKPVHGTI